MIAATLLKDFEYTEEIIGLCFTTLTEQHGELICDIEFDKYNVKKTVEKWWIEDDLLNVRIKDGVWRK